MRSRESEPSSPEDGQSHRTFTRIEALRMELLSLLGKRDGGVMGPQMECVDVTKIRYRLARAWSRSHRPITRARNSK